jgi:sec-independent protein translocase protein TatA
MFSGLESPMHLLVVLVIAALVLGPKKLPEVGRSLGSGIRSFKDSIEGNEKKPD